VLAYGRDGLVDERAPELEAQVLYARDHEWALTADDVLRRRTALAIRGLDTPEVRARVEALLA
jgi:glycerol-3-phosphate dehydrogenase